VRILNCLQVSKYVNVTAPLVVYQH